MFLKDKKDFFKLALKNLVLIAIIIIFISSFSSIFGYINQFLGVALITAILMFLNINIGIDKKQAPFVIFGLYFLIAVAITIERYNIYLAIVTNALTIFTIMILTTVKVEFKPYIPFMLMYIFAQGNPCPMEEIWKRFFILVGCGLVLAILYYARNRKSEEEGKTVKEIFKSISLENQTTVFSIKMAIGVTLAMFIIDFWGMTRGMWISACTLAITQPHSKTTRQTMKLRVLGTIIGILGYFLIFGAYIIPQQYFVYLTFLLAYVYTFIKNYIIQVIFITINALNAAQVIFESNFHSILSRISFIGLSCIIVLFVLLLEKIFLDKKVKECQQE